MQIKYIHEDLLSLIISDSEAAELDLHIDNNAGAPAYRETLSRIMSVMGVVGRNIEEIAVNRIADGVILEIKLQGNREQLKKAYRSASINYIYELLEHTGTTGRLTFAENFYIFTPLEGNLINRAEEYFLEPCDEAPGAILISEDALKDLIQSV